MVQPCLYIADGIEFELRLNNSSGMSTPVTLTRAEELGLIFVKSLSSGGAFMRIWIFSNKIEFYFKPKKEKTTERRTNYDRKKNDS